jgi:hypothetical protein
LGEKSGACLDASGAIALLALTERGRSCFVPYTSSSTD